MLAIKARYDGRKVILPKEKRFPVGAVIIIFEKSDEAGDDKRDWQKLSRQHLACAYSSSEPEYSRSRIKESNEEYKPLKRAKSS